MLLLLPFIITVDFVTTVAFEVLLPAFSKEFRTGAIGTIDTGSGEGCDGDGGVGCGSKRRSDTVSQMLSSLVGGKGGVL